MVTRRRLAGIADPGSLDTPNYDRLSTILEAIEALRVATPDTILTTTGAGDLQTAIDTMNDGDILEVKSNGTYNPITIPAAKRLRIKVAPGYRPQIQGTRCIRLSNGAEDVIISGLLITNATPGNKNYEGAAVTFAEHETIVNNIILHNISVGEVNSGSAVMLAYHWSVGGDSYDTANLPEENSDGVAFIDCNFYKGSKDGTEGAAIVMRGCDESFVYNCNFDCGDLSRGIMLHNSREYYIGKNTIFGAGGGNGEGIKVDEMGTCTYFGVGVIEDNRITGGIEGVDVDDKQEAIVRRNKINGCSAEGISLDNGSKMSAEANVVWECNDGIECEAGSVCELRNNICFRNVNNYKLDNGYSKDASNLETYMGTWFTPPADLDKKIDFAHDTTYPLTLTNLAIGEILKEIVIDIDPGFDGSTVFSVGYDSNQQALIGSGDMDSALATPQKFFPYFQAAVAREIKLYKQSGSPTVGAGKVLLEGFRP